MKIEIEIDVSPEEMRRFFGLPDVKPFQDAVLEKLEQSIETGASELDPARLMQAFLAPTSSTMEAMQNTFWQAFTAAGKDKSAE